MPQKHISVILSVVYKINTHTHTDLSGTAFFVCARESRIVIWFEPYNINMRVYMCVCVCVFVAVYVNHQAKESHTYIYDGARACVIVLGCQTFAPCYIGTHTHIRVYVQLRWVYGV